MTKLDDHDPYLWLEEVDGDDALAWVKARNADTEADLFAEPRFEELRAEFLALLESDDRLVIPSKHGDEVTNFWTDAVNRRGRLRRTTWDDFRSGTPTWATVLDIDALAAADGESWVAKGFDRRPSDRRRMLVDLSPGGGDATVTREFDLIDTRFVTEAEGGFVRSLSKGWLQWIDDDTVYVASDFGAGTMTTSGYPRTIRRWPRGTPIDGAPVVFEGDDRDVSVSVSVSRVPERPHHLFARAIDCYNSQYMVLPDGTGDTPVELDVPTDVDVDVHGDWLLMRPRSDWTVGSSHHAAGSLLAANLDRWLAGERVLTAVFTPDDHTSLGTWAWTRQHLLLLVQRDVRFAVEVCRPDAGWSRRPVPGASDLWTQSAFAMHMRETDEILVTGEDFLTPATLFYLASVDAEPEQIGQAPARFATDGLAITQHFATSPDGTLVPYFVVGSEGIEGPRPTWLTGYGGFEVSRNAAYSGMIGRSWLARGGVYVLANLRGGGEYGPRWHQSALRDKRHRVYEDCEAVARDLIDRGITTAPQLGLSGGSNGGLLVGNMLVRCPELFGAIVCQVPLLDMKRYSHLLAGASWMAEYGDPDIADDWAFIRTFSPYHLVEADQPYPPLLLTTSTRDDRVHPGHARKMVARLTELGYELDYWENIEGGHGGAADAPQQAIKWALTLTFLHRHLFA